MYEPIFTVKFTDETEFVGGNLKAPKWTKCPDQEINSLRVHLPYGDEVVLSGYEKYNFFIGASKDLRGGELTIQHLFALGCNDKTVVSYRITLTSQVGNKYRIGDMTVRNFPLGKEGIGRTSTSGWKKGIKKTN